MRPFNNPGRVAGALYLLSSASGFFSYMYVHPALIVAGNAAATANNILAKETLFRIGIVSELISAILFTIQAIVLYRLLSGVNKTYALLMATLILVSVPITCLNVLNDLAALSLIQGPAFLAVFQKPELEALAMMFLSLHSRGVTIANIFWGLWLFPFGILVYRSSTIPRVLGILLIPAGSAYAASSLVLLLSPSYGSAVFLVSVVAGVLGEGLTMAWLLVKGAKVQPSTGEP